MDGRFDRDYYERFYFDPASSVTSRAEMNARGRLIGACARHIGLPVKRLLDAGCGVGLLRAPLRRALPEATYTGIVPDTFQPDAEVVLKGVLGPDGFVVQPNGVMAKCPSKYEAQVDTKGRGVAKQGTTSGGE